MRKSAHMVRKESQRPLSGQVRRRRIVGSALVTVEAVVGVVDLHLDARLRPPERLYAVE